MKISALTHTYPRFTDDINAPFVEHLMENIAQQGNDVSVLTAYDQKWDRKPDDHTVDLRTYRYIWPDRLHVLGYSRTIEGNVRFRKRVLALSPFLFLGAYRSFLRLVREKKPDILHAHWILPNGYIAARVSRATGIPLLIQLHGSDVFTAEKNALFRHMARLSASQAHYITSPSPDLTERLGAIGIDTKKIGLVPNAVEADFSGDVTDEAVGKLKSTLDIPTDHTVVLAVGRMVYVKGFNYLLEAFARVIGEIPDVTLVLAGGGMLLNEMKELAGRLGIGDRVRIPGAVMRDEVPVYFKMADIFVTPSIRHESGAVDGLPVVVPEAMAAGLPVIGSDLSGIPVLVRDGSNGALVKERDVKGLAEAMKMLIRNPAKRRAYGERSKQIIKNSVNYGNIAGYLSTLYREIAQNRTPAEDITPFEID
jgi:glycosyltransferase involved in cell wall biosynthesis